MINLVPSGTGVTSRTHHPAGTIINLPPERLKAFSRTVNTGGLGESLHGQARRDKIGMKWFEEEIQLDIWALGGEFLQGREEGNTHGVVVIYHLIAIQHPYAAGRDSTSYTPSTRSVTVKAKARKGKATQEDAESINQFTQTQIQEESGRKGKRKFLAMEIDIDSEEEDEYSVHPHGVKGWAEIRGGGGVNEKKYTARPAGYSWDEYRKTHGQGTVGSGDTDEQRAASRALEDVKSFVVSLHH